MTKKDLISLCLEVSKDKKISLEYINFARMQKKEIEELKMVCELPPAVMDALFKVYASKFPNVAERISMCYLTSAYFRQLVWQFATI